MLGRNRWIAGLGMALAAAGAAAAQTSRAVPVYVNQDRLDSDALLLKRVNRTVLPMRVLFEALGARVEWDPAQRAVYAWRPDGAGVRLALEETSAQTLRMDRNPAPGHWGRVTGSHSLDAPPMLLAGRVYVPLRFASEALRADVRFASSEPAVHIQTQAVAGERQEVARERPRIPEPPVERKPPAEREPPVEREPPRIPEPPIERRPPVEPERPREPAPRRAAALDLWLELEDRQIDVDARAVPIRLVVRNTSDVTAEIPFRSGQRFDVELLEGDQLLWNWARHRSYAPVGGSLTLRPGEQRSFLAGWRLDTNNGRRIRPGRYLLRGILTSDFAGRPMVAEQRITIR